MFGPLCALWTGPLRWLLSQRVCKRLNTLSEGGEVQGERDVGNRGGVGGATSVVGYEP